jgi:esterase/lipase superfamily enzyme/predicted acylesterase/phospholipase RssA
VETVPAIDTSASPENQSPPAGQRAPRIGLALSGGGLRATFFHLGVVKFLRKTNLLKRVTHICSVSGGSILAAHLVLNWEKYNGTDKDYSEVEAELIGLGHRDVRGRVMRRWIFAILSPLLVLMRWGRWGRTSLLEWEYARFFKDALLHDLAGKPKHPRPQLHMLTTSFTTGHLCSFSSDGFWTNGGHSSKHYRSSIMPLSLAVAASSAYPPLFTPVVVTREMLNATLSDLPHGLEYLTDGGVFDNSGFEKLMRLRAEGALDVDTILLSDASARFDYIVKRIWWTVTRTIRSTDILMKRVSDATESHANKGIEGIRTIQIKISDIVPRTSVATALPEDLQTRLSFIRTDLDRFSSGHMALLIGHGYEVALKMIGEQELIADPKPTVVEGSPSIEEWSGEKISATAKSLDIALRRKLRILDRRDWVSYGFVLYILAFPALAGIFLFFQQLGLNQQRTQLSNVIQDIQVREAEIAAIEPRRISSAIAEELSQRPLGLDQLIARVLVRLGVTENSQTISLVRAQIQKQAESGVLVSISDGPDRGKMAIFMKQPVKGLSLIFATDRRDDKASDFEVRFGSARDQLQFGVANIEVAGANPGSASADAIVAIRSASVVSSAEIALQSLALNTRSNEATVFIHGYNTRMVDALRIAGRLFYDLNLGSIPVLFSWPSDGIAINYFMDEESSRYAGRDFVELIELLRKQGISKNNVIAYGMGAQTLLEGLRNLRSRAQEPQLDQVIFFVPDVDESLFAQVVQETSGVAQRITLYVNPDDLALRMSQIIRRSKRAGLATRVMNGVDTVVISERESTLFGGGTLLTRPSIVRDLSEVLSGRATPARRSLVE